MSADVWFIVLSIAVALLVIVLGSTR